jgi:hypothetical protein
MPFAWPSPPASKNRACRADRRPRRSSPGSRNNLANSHQDAGRLDEAISPLERTLVDYQRILDNAHARTLTSRNKLANAWPDVGRLDDAEGLRSCLSPNHDCRESKRTGYAVAAH